MLIKLEHIGTKTKRKIFFVRSLHVENVTHWPMTNHIIMNFDLVEDRLVWSCLDEIIQYEYEPHFLYVVHVSMPVMVIL